MTSEYNVYDIVFNFLLYNGLTHQQMFYQRTYIHYDVQRGKTDVALKEIEIEFDIHIDWHSC